MKKLLMGRSLPLPTALSLAGTPRKLDYFGTAWQDNTLIQYDARTLSLDVTKLRGYSWDYVIAQLIFVTLKLSMAGRIATNGCQVLILSHYSPNPKSGPHR